MKKIMRRLLSSIVISAVFAQFGAVYAQQLDPEMIEMYRSQREEQLFEQMSELVSEKIRLDARPVKDTVRMTEIDDEMSRIDAALEAVGVHKMDANDPEDLALMAEVMLGGEQGNQVYNSRSMEPDLSYLADAYSVYETSGSTVINGVTYPYRTFRIVDNKGMDRLYTNDITAELIGAVSSTLSEVLSYNLSFLTSSLWSEIPYSWVVDWTIGNVFTVLNSYSGSSIFSTNETLYYMSINSTTEMTYHYINVSDNWALCGSRASRISWSRLDFFAGNLNGTAIHDDKNFGTQYTSTGVSSVATYLNYYLSYSSPRHDTIGSMYIVGAFGQRTRFAPVYASTPLDLL